jgi:hypothetical protein
MAREQGCDRTITFIYLLFQPRVLQKRWGLSQNDLFFNLESYRVGEAFHKMTLLGYLHVLQNACEERGCAYLHILSSELQCISLLESICIVLLLSLKCIFVFALHLLEIALWKKERHPENLFHVSHSLLHPALIRPDPNIRAALKSGGCHHDGRSLRCWQDLSWLKDSLWFDWEARSGRLGTHAQRLVCWSREGCAGLHALGSVCWSVSWSRWWTNGSSP